MYNNTFGEPEISHKIYHKIHHKVEITGELPSHPILCKFNASDATVLVGANPLPLRQRRITEPATLPSPILTAIRKCNHLK